VATLAGVASSVVVGAGQHDSARPFRSEVSLVPVTVSVERDDGTYAAGIDVSRFHVLDEGAPRDIAVFDDGNVPIDLVLLLDTSSSMNARLSTMRSAATRIVQALRPNDRATLLSFGVRTTILQPFTSDVGVLTKALARLSCDGATSLYDALYVALHEFGSAATEIRRRAVLVLSDGDDTASLITFDVVLDEARRRAVATYTIRLMSPFEKLDPFKRSAMELREMARDTGGRAFTTQGTQEVAVAYESIAREIAHQYVLGFIPAPGEKEGFHRVTVLVNAPKVRVRARAGYLATGN
jgi:VWFA-related protein